MDHSQHHEQMSHHEEKASKSRLKEYLPLIIILGSILLIVGLWQNYLGGFDLQDSMRMFMGLFFLLFGSFKLMDLRGFVDAYQGYDIVAKRSRAYGFLYPFIELSLGASFLLNLYPFWTNVATVVVMGVSSIGVIQAVTGKRKIQCACLGTVVKLPMTTVTIIEDLGMGLMALIMLSWM